MFLIKLIFKEFHQWPLGLNNYEELTSKDWNLRATWNPTGTVIFQMHSLLGW
jgi:hypothetical protein